MAVKGKDESRLRYRDYQLAKEIEAKTKCVLTVCAKSWPTQQKIEVGICGQPEDVKMAKELIPERLVSTDKRLLRYLS